MFAKSFTNLSSNTFALCNSLIFTKLFFNVSNSISFKLIIVFNVSTSFSNIFILNSKSLSPLYLSSFSNVLSSAKEHGVKKLVSLLSTCVYPDKAKYPLTPDQFHNGAPHKSNFGYAYSKRMLDVYSRALRQQYGCNFICAVPNNLYGIRDNFDLENGHVIPAIIRKVHDAKLKGRTPVFWGDGSALREFTYASDISRILLYLLANYDGEDPVNIGTTEERSIKSVVRTICSCLDYTGDVIWDESKPSGQARKPSSNQKLLDLGWNKKDYTSFEEGIRLTCDWYKENYPNVRGIK